MLQLWLLLELQSTPLVLTQEGKNPSYGQVIASCSFCNVPTQI